MSDRGDRHDELRQLVPWFANGTLEGAEAERLSAHLESCAECRAELDSCRRLGERLRERLANAPAPHPVQLRRLLDRLEQPQPDEQPEPRSPRRRLGHWPAAARWLVAAQFAALALLGFAFGSRTAPEPGFRTLSAPQSSTAGRGIARVVFAEGVREVEMRALLLELEAEILGGPSPLGVYTLALPARLSGEPRAWLVAHLSSRPELRFVELIEPVESDE
jgi:anti-sigma factor RsiW